MDKLQDVLDRIAYRLLWVAIFLWIIGIGCCEISSTLKKIAGSM